jgi:hypothetical protein
MPMPSCVTDSNQTPTSSTDRNRLPHPGVIAVPLTDGPPLLTRLVRRSDTDHPLVRSWPISPKT